MDEQREVGAVLGKAHPQPALARHPLPPPYCRVPQRPGSCGVAAQWVSLGHGQVLCLSFPPARGCQSCSGQHAMGWECWAQGRPLLHGLTCAAPQTAPWWPHTCPTAGPTPALAAYPMGSHEDEPRGMDTPTLPTHTHTHTAIL